MKFWTDKQWMDSTKEQREYYRRSLATDAQKNEEIFAHQNEAYAGFKSAIYALEAGQRGLRWLTGESMKGLSMAGMVDTHWQSQDARDFRYHSLPLFQGYATYVHGIFDALEHGYPTPDVVISHAAVYAAEEAAKGFPWAKANSDKVEQYTMATLDPMLATSWLFDGVKAVGASREIKNLVPFAEKLMAASRTEGAERGANMVLASKALWGGDAGSPLFVNAVSDMLKNKATAEDVAGWMYHNVGLRTNDWALMNKMPLSDYFKRGWNLYSPRLKDIAQDFTWYKQAIEKEQLTALERVPDLSKKELEQVQWAMHNIPRSPFDPKGSFVANWNKAIVEGKVNPLSVSPETFEKMKTVAGELSAGWRNNSEWKSAYSPSAAKSDYLIGEASEGLSSRTWQEHQKNWEPFDKVDDYRRAVAKVNTRVYKADTVDAFRTNVQGRVSNINAALEKLGYATDHIPELLEKAPKEVRNLYNEREVLQRMTKDLKMMQDSVDPIAKLAAKDPTGYAEKLRRGYLQAARLYKVMLLRYTPFWAIHRGGDMMARSAIETGNPAAKEILQAVRSREILPARDYSGKVMDFSRSPLEGLYSGLPTGRQKGFEKMVEHIDAAAQNHIGQYVYDKNLGAGIRAGLNPETAHAYALRAAKERLDVVHGMYQNKSSMQRMFDYTHPFLGHYVQRMAYGLTIASEHPSEVYAAMRMRQAQEDMSIDNKGAIRLGNTVVGVDPVRRLTPTQVMEPFLHTDQILNAQEEGVFKLQRGLQALTGEPFPQINWLEQKAGVKPETNSRPMAEPFESIANFATKAIAGMDIMPSDPLYQLLGKNPGEDRERYLSRQAGIQIAASKLEGAPIAPDEAVHKAEQRQLENHLGSYVGVVTASEAESRVFHALSDVRQAILQAKPEDRAAMRQQVVQEWKDKGLDIEKVAPLDPQARFQAIKGMLDREDAKVEALKTVPDAKAPSMEDLIETMRHSRAGQIFEKVYNAMVPKAGAEDFDPQAFRDKIQKGRESMGQNPPEQSLGPDARALPNGQTFIPSDGTQADRVAKIHATLGFNSHLSNLADLPTVQAKADYIKSLEQSDGTNPLLDSLKRLSVNSQGASPQAAHYLSAYDYTYNDGAKITGELDRTNSQTAYGTTAAFKNYVAHGGPEAWKLVSGPWQNVIDAFKNGKFSAVGVDPIAGMDKYSALLAQQSISAGGLGMIQKQWETDRVKEYPGNSFAKAALENAVIEAQRGDPHVVSKTIDQINETMALGKNATAAGKIPVSPDFWEGIRSIDTRTYANAAIFAHANEINGTARYISDVGESGKFYGVNVARVLDTLEHPGGNAAIAALREYGSPQMKSALDSAGQIIDSLNASGHGPGKSLDEMAPHDDYSMGQFFIHGMDIRTGNAEPQYYERFLPGAKTSQPGLNDKAVGGQTLQMSGGKLTPVPSAGHAAVAADFEGQKLNIENPSVLPRAEDSKHPLIDSRSSAQAASDISQHAFGNMGAVGMGALAAEANLEIAHPTETPVPVKDKPYTSIGAYVHGTLVDYANAKEHQQAYGGPPPSLYQIGMGNLTYRAPQLDDKGQPVLVNGKQVYQDQPGFNVQGSLQAMDALANIGTHLAGSSPNSPESAIVSGLGTGLATYSALTHLGLTATVGQTTAAIAGLAAPTAGTAIAGSAALGGTAAGTTAAVTAAELGTTAAAGTAAAGTAAGATAAGLGTAAGATASTGVGLPIAAVLATAAAAYMISDQMGKKKGLTEAQQAANQEHVNAQQRAYNDRLQQNDVREIQNREHVLSLADHPYKGVTVDAIPLQRRVQEHHRQPTFASRIGLVDTIERSLSSALVPRW